MATFKTNLLAMVLSMSAFSAQAESWSLDPALSNVSFASIKNDYFGESHQFRNVSGNVSQTGVVEINIDLASVETNIDIRNERLIEQVFRTAQQATVTAEVDMTEFNDIAVGEGRTIDTFGNLSLVGLDTELDAKLFVMRISEEQVLVTTEGMVMISTEDAGLDKGIDVLQDLAGLDSITRVSPVTMRLVFNADGAQS